MVSVPGRAKCAPIRSGTTPCVEPSDFDPELYSLSDDVGDDVNALHLRRVPLETLQIDTHELTSPKGPEGLRGAANGLHGGV